MLIHSVPTAKLKKKIYDAFYKAKDADKNPLFSQSDLKVLTDTLNAMSSEDSHREIEYKKYTVVINIDALEEEDSGPVATDDSGGAGETDIAEQPENDRS